MYTEEKDDINKLFYEKLGIDNDIYQKYAVGSHYESIHPEDNWDPDGYPRPVHDEYVIWAKERQK